MRQAVYSHYQRAKVLYGKLERWLMPLTLLVGFIIDYVTFVSIQINTALWLLGAYLTSLAFFIAFINLYDAGALVAKFRWLRLYSPLALQFFFGGVLGNSFIFYWFSSSLYTSWPFILLFVLLMVLNDVFRHEFLKLKYQIPFFCFLSFSVFSVVLPFTFNSLNPAWFVLAGALGLFLTFVFYGFLHKWVKPGTSTTVFVGVTSVVIFLSMNGLYFSNLVPPVPLVVREALPVHSVEKKGEMYILKTEKPSFWQKFGLGFTVHVAQGERVYIYSAVYAPVSLNTTILHEWQFKDPETKVWTTKDTLEFNLVGGRREGFRGYSWKSNLKEGEWRVNVKTPRNQVVGRVNFTLVKSDVRPELYEVTR